MGLERLKEMRYHYKTNGTCAKEISFELDGDMVMNVQFTGGCQGNLKAIARLVEGKTVEELEYLLSNITCGNKRTSCADQLVRGVRNAYEKTLQLI